jgi:hypothetical protein
MVSYGSQGTGACTAFLKVTLIGGVKTTVPFPKFTFE